MKDKKFFKDGDVFKDLRSGNIYFCIKTYNDKALISPTHLNEDWEWSFSINEQMVISNIIEEYDEGMIEFIKRN